MNYDKITLETELIEPEESHFEFQFFRQEKTGMIEYFDVSENGRIATCINSTSPDSINIYDPYGYYDFTVDTSFKRGATVLQWDHDALLIFLDTALDSGYEFARINGYEDYEIYRCPVNTETEKFWNQFTPYKSELSTETGRYYVKYGNLRYTDHATGADYPITENTSFQPWWLLSIPVLTAVIWFGYLKKRVIAWENEKEKEKNKK